MGKFDQLEKYLGKEDLYNPAEINSALDSIADDAESMNFGTGQEIDPDALANIDELLKVTGDFDLGDSNNPQEDGDISLSGQEMEAIDQPDLIEESDGSDMDLSQFSALNMDDDENAAEELAALQFKEDDAGADDFSFDAAPDSQSSGPTANISEGMDFSSLDTSPVETEEIPVGQIDPEVLDQLQNLDSAPPPISEIQTRRYTENLGQSEEVNDIESDLAAMSSQDFDIDMEEPEGSPLDMGDIDADITDGSEAGEFGDLLSQLSPTQEAEAGMDEANGPLMPEIGSEMDELSSMLAGTASTRRCDRNVARCG